MVHDAQQQLLVEFESQRELPAQLPYSIYELQEDRRSLVVDRLDASNMTVAQSKPGMKLSVTLRGGKTYLWPKEIQSLSIRMMKPYNVR